ncbi:MAG: site-specific integrase [Cyanobacteria bacterium]|nr:site-specific integrase [Cyanobacteriota bacterium]
MMNLDGKKQIEYLAEWAKAMACGLMGGRPFSKDTVYTYTLYTRHFLETYEEITVSHLKKALMDIPVNQYAKRYKLYQALHCFVVYLVEEELMAPTYLEAAKPYIPKRHIPPKKKTVHEKEIEALLQACETSQERLIVALLAFTGLRVSEAASLKITDINMTEGYLTVQLAKWGKTRRVGLSQRLKEIFQEHLKNTQNAENHSGWLFLDRLGEKITRFGIRTRLAKLGNRVGVEVTPHALRRAFVTINANKGRPLPMLQIACGHSNITTTRSYCMTSEDETIEAMQSWD